MTCLRRLLILCAALLSAAVLGQPRYEVEEVLSLRGGIALAHGLGNNGFVVGSVDFGTYYSAFRWKQGTMELLSSPYKSSSAYGVNSQGDATGAASDGGDGARTTAALWDPVDFHSLGDLGGGDAGGLSVNSRKWVVGLSYVYPHDGEFHPFLYRNGKMEDLGLLGIPQNHYSKAVRINEQNAVIGWETDGEGSYDTPWIWTESGGMQRLFPEINRGGGVPQDLNDLGEITIGDMIWRDGKLRTLPDAYGFNGINNYSEVTGFLKSTHRPGVWLGGVPYDLQALLLDGSYTLDGVYDINDQGQILATAYRGGQWRSVLLTPVPEPATPGIMGAGLVAFACRRRRRRPG